MSPARRSPAAGGRPHDDWVERVRAASDIVEVVGQSVALRRSGRNWVGLCPFHAEKTPSFAVHPERQFYHCFSCKAGGDVFRFVQEIEKLGFLEAAELLSRRAGIPVPERRAGERTRRAPLEEALEAAATAYEQWLGDPQQGARARAYLEERGFDRGTLREFRIGLAPAGWENLAQRLRERFPEEVLVQAGLAARREGPGRGIYDRFRNRIMVPLVAPGGQVVGFGARALDPGDQPKYLNSPESAVYHKGSFLYAYEQARRRLAPGDELVVVEGYFDAMALHQAGVHQVVATSGTALTADHARRLARVVGRVALTYDGDAAGREATMRSLGVLMAEGLEVAVVDLPAGQDPDTLVREGGAEAWAAVRERAADPIEFVQRHGLREGGGEAPALRAVVRLAGVVADPIRRHRLLERGAQVFGLSERVLERAVRLERGGQSAERPIAAAVDERRHGAAQIERQLLQAVLMAPEALEAARARIGPGDFAEPRAAALAAWIWEHGEEPPEDPDAAALARELVAEAAPEAEWARIAEADARRLLRRRLERESRRVRQRLEQLQRQGKSDDPETLELLQETQDLHRSIRSLNP